VCLSRSLTALGTIKDNPGAKIVREVFEAMRYSSRDEQKVADGEGMAAIPVDEPTAASHHYV
jgi:hypothetical protein